MRPLYALIFALSFLFTSCDKDLSYEGGHVPPVEEPPVVIPPPLTTEEELKQLFADYQFQLRAFYSDTPIDFNPNDGDPTPETDFWNYVPAYLKDDSNKFDENGGLSIVQNTNKKPGLTAETLTRSYSISQDANGYYIMFLDANYDPLQYRIAETGTDYFILSVAGPNGSTLFSRFEKI
jgi:hypothetical protein